MFRIVLAHIGIEYEGELSSQAMLSKARCALAAFARIASTCSSWNAALKPNPSLESCCAFLCAEEFPWLMRLHESNRSVVCGSLYRSRAVAVRNNGGPDVMDALLGTTAEADAHLGTEETTPPYQIAFELRRSDDDVCVWSDVADLIDDAEADIVARTPSVATGPVETASGETKHCLCRMGPDGSFIEVEKNGFVVGHRNPNGHFNSAVRICVFVVRRSDSAMFCIGGTGELSEEVDDEDPDDPALRHVFHFTNETNGQCTIDCDVEIGFAGGSGNMYPDMFPDCDDDFGDSDGESGIGDGEAYMHNPAVQLTLDCGKGAARNGASFSRLLEDAGPALFGR